MPTDRRGFLQTGAALAAASLIPAEAKSAPAPARAKFKLSLAAYSLRKALDLKNPTMTLEEFIEKSVDLRVSRHITRPSRCLFPANF